MSVMATLQRIYDPAQQEQMDFSAARVPSTSRRSASLVNRRDDKIGSRRSGNLELGGWGMSAARS